MSGIKTQLFYKLEGFLLKLSSKRSKFRQWYIKQKDEALGREMVGIDKFGNKYYQYYSFHGLPTKRIVLYKFFDTNKFNIDPHFLDWLNRRDLLPPSPEELEKMYLEHEAFNERGLEWDEQQQKMIEEHQKKMEEIGKAIEEENQIEEEKLNEEQKWVPDQQKAQNARSLQTVSPIDKLEHEYYKEYQKVMNKDEAKGKDFNKLVYDEAKRAKYFFEYLRKQEQLYQYEQQNLQSQEKTQSNNEQNSQHKEQVKSATQQQKEIQSLESIKQNEEKMQSKKDELKSNRYKEFREEFEDVFEQVLERKGNKQNL